MFLIWGFSNVRTTSTYDSTSLSYTCVRAPACTHTHTQLTMDNQTGQQLLHFIPSCAKHRACPQGDVGEVDSQPFQSVTHVNMSEVSACHLTLCTVKRKLFRIVTSLRSEKTFPPTSPPLPCLALYQTCLSSCTISQHNYHKHICFSPVRLLALQNFHIHHTSYNSLVDCAYFISPDTAVTLSLVVNRIAPYFS